MEVLFWISTLVPGLAVAGRFFAPDSRRGLLATSALSFVLTTVLFTPVIILAFVVNLPASVVSFVYLGLLAWGAWSLYSRREEQPFRAFFSDVWPEALLPLAIVVAVGLLGGEVLSDHSLHAGKLNFLKEFGFSLQDPYSPMSVIEPRHHVSTYHGLHVAGCWLTDCAPLAWWFNSSWFFLALTIGGFQLIAHRLFESRWVAVCVAIGAAFVVTANKLSPLPIPNTTAVWAILPVLIVQLMGLMAKPDRMAYAKVFAITLALGAVHPGFWVVTVLCLGPTVALWGFMEWRQGRSIRPSLATVAVLSVGFPFALISAVQSVDFVQTAEMGQPWEILQLGLGGLTLSMINPRIYSWLAPACGAALLLLVVRGRRREDLIFGSIVVTALLYMFFPPVFGILSQIIPHWMIKRSILIVELAAVLAMAGGLAWLLRDSLNRRLAQALFALTLFLSGFVAFRTEIKEDIADRERQVRWLERSEDLRTALSPLMTGRPLIAANQNVSNIIPPGLPASVMSPRDGGMNPVDATQPERKADGRELLHPDTPMERRLEIIQKHGVEFVVVMKGQQDESPDAFRQLGTLVADGLWFQAYRVSADGT